MRRIAEPSVPRAVMKIICLLAFIPIFLIAGCAGPLQVNYNPAAPQEGLKLKTPVSIKVEPFKDSRPAPSRTIGKVDATVADMTGSTLVLSEDAASLVARAFVHELASFGYTVKTGPEEADLVLTGEVRGFKLDIGARDYLFMEYSAKVVDKPGNEVWSGGGVEKNERYAGVMGNSRSTISNYITASLSKLARKSVAEITLRAENRASAPESAPKEDRGIEKAMSDGMGSLVITTNPQRSKVYIKDVYYGLTPLSLDLDPGVHEVTVKQNGYRDSSEKVSVRKGETTELDISLEK